MIFNRHYTPHSSYQELLSSQNICTCTPFFLIFIFISAVLKVSIVICPLSKQCYTCSQYTYFEGPNIPQDECTCKQKSWPAAQAKQETIDLLPQLSRFYPNMNHKKTPQFLSGRNNFTRDGSLEDRIKYKLQYLYNVYFFRVMKTKGL